MRKGSGYDFLARPPAGKSFADMTDAEIDAWARDMAEQTVAMERHRRADEDES